MGAPRTLPRVPVAPTPVRFPSIERDRLESGLGIWSLNWPAVPIVTIALYLDGGSAEDPLALPGLAALTADLTDEGAGGRDAVQLSEAFAALGAHLDVDVSQEATLLSFTTLARNLDPALALLADVIMRPHLDAAGLSRVRDLRLSRLRQLSTSASATAERAFLEGLFGAHPYGHGTMGTSRALEAVSLDDARACHAGIFAPARATLIVAGDVSVTAAVSAARRCFRDWHGDGGTARPIVAEPVAPAPRCLLVDRPGAPQSELRIGHLGPARQAPQYYALTTLNAALGGQFTSRINQQLREAKGFTYGARTGFDFRRESSSFACDTSVQGDATIEAIGDVLDAFEAVGSSQPIEGEELARAQGSLTRGYVRHFETAAHLVRAAIELVKFGLPDDTFDRYVPGVSAVTAADVLDAARRFVRPSDCVIAIVGDAARHRDGLARFGRDVLEMRPEF